MLGDDLYSCQPICQLVLEQGYNFIFVAKPSSHKSLYEWIDLLEKNKEVITGTIKKYEGGKQRLYGYRYANNLPREIQIIKSPVFIFLLVSICTTFPK